MAVEALLPRFLLEMENFQITSQELKDYNIASKDEGTVLIQLGHSVRLLVGKWSHITFPNQDLVACSHLSKITELKKTGETCSEDKKIEDTVIHGILQHAHNWNPKITKIEKITNQ